MACVQDMVSIERFLEEMEKSSIVEASALQSLSHALQEARAFVARVAALFTESILVFAMVQLDKSSSDPKAKKRHHALVASQIAQVKGSKFGVTEDMIHDKLWEKAEQLHEQQAEAKPAKMPKVGNH